MNKSKIYKILYYLIFLITIFMCCYISKLINTFGVAMETPINVIFGVINLILVIVFSIKIKNKLNKINILFPIVHILFMIIVSILAIIMNDKLIIPNIHYGYYISFILFNYLLLNIYSVLSINK